jgi:hypothetical protein
VIPCRLDTFDRPCVDVVLHGRNGPLPAEPALLDTGSDTALFPERLMGPLGVDRAECWEELILGQLGTGTKAVLRTDVTIGVEVGGSRCIPVLAAFSADCPPLLGVDFFRHFAFTYDPANRRIGLHARPDTPLLTGVLLSEGAA